jgi:hypothetical protein
MVRRRLRTVSRKDVTTTLAVMGALRTISPTRILGIVQASPEITVVEFCESYLAGLRPKCYGGTRRAYSAVYSRLWRARRRLDLLPAGSPRRDKLLPTSPTER